MGSEHMLEKYLDKEGILLIPSRQKKRILDCFHQQSCLVKLKVLTEEEFKKAYYYDYDEKTLTYLLLEKKITPELAQIYLENSYYVDENKKYEEDKLQALADLKKELMEKGLLKTNSFFRHSLKNKTILIDSFSSDELIEKALKEMASDIKVIRMEPLPPTKVPNVYHFTTIEEEVRFVAQTIRKQKEKGIAFSKMHLLNVTSEYESVLPRIFSLYQIPVEPITTSKLYGTVLGQKYLNICKASKTWEEVVTMLQEEKDKTYYDLLISISNRYRFYSKEVKDLLPLLTMELKKTAIPSVTYREKVTIGSLYSSFEVDDLIFLLGCNQEHLPKVIEDKDYLNNREKQKLGLRTTQEQNQKEKKHLLTYLEQLSNLIITYKDQDAFEKYEPALFLKEKEWKVEEAPYSTEIYSVLDAKLQFVEGLDLYNKYGMKTKTLERYGNHFKEIPYLTYRNDFTGVQEKDLYTRLKQQLTLSYTSLDQYYRCAFRYYMGQILKLEPKEETFAIRIGTIFHQILARAFTKDFDLEQAYAPFLEAAETNKERFFLKKLKEELSFVIETIKKQNKITSFDQALYEKKITIEKDQNIKINFVGVVDKILSKEEEGTTYLAIVDYKTGHLPSDFSNLYYGIEMQLPVYLYLVQKANLFPKARFTGFYLQKILNNEITIEKNKSYRELKEENLRWVGYSNSDEEVLSKMDPDYVNSSLVRGLKMTANGFAHYSKVLDDQEMEALAKWVENKIDQAITEIVQGHFPINPKQIGKNLKGCEYCPFQELCYLKQEDKVYLQEKKDLTFLRGDTDA